MANNNRLDFEIGVDSDEANRRLNQTAESTKRLGDSARQMGSGAKQGAGGLSEADRAAGRFYDSSGKLREANGQFVKGAQQAGEAAKGLGKEMTSVGGIADGLNTKLKAIAAGIAAYFGISAFGNVIKGAADFEEAMSRVQAATNSSGQELKALKTAAEQAGATTKFTSIEAAAALENLAKAGLNGKEAIAALPAVMSMAQAGGVSLADASERLTGVVMGMGLKFEESGRVADVLAMGANASKTSITGLAEAMSYAAPIAKTVGLSLESTTAIVGQFANAGIDAGRAGTALNSILSQFSDPASKFKQELLALGISTNDFDQALKQLAAAGPNGANAIRAVGLEAGPALQAAINLSIPALEELRAKLQGAEGSAAATAKTMGDNLNGALKGLSSAWDAVKNTLGEPVLPVLKQGVDELAASLRTAIDNGTIAKFGAALSEAFKSAIEWVRQFMGSMDWNKVTTDLQAFAAQAGDVFKQIGDYATNAGNIVKTAYGVMSAGGNAVLAPIYLVGEAFLGVSRDVMQAVAFMNEQLSKIAIGETREKLRLAAEDARSMAQGFGEASVAMSKKASEAFDGIVKGATLANEGFAGLSGASDGTATSLKTVAAAAEAVKLTSEGLAIALQKEFEGLFKAREEAEKKVKADKEKTETDKAALQAMADREAKTLSLALADKSGAEATKTSADKVKELNAQYKAAMADGDWMRAADIQAQITKEMTAAPPAVNKAAAAIAELKAQYKQAVADGEWQKAAELQAQITKEMSAAGPAAQKAAAGVKDYSEAIKAVPTEVKDALASMGLEWVKLTDGIGSESAKTITNINTIVGSLDQLKKAGIDTGLVLSTSISKAIDTADSQKSLDLLKQKIEEVRSTLGNKIADGLLDQAKQKALELKDAMDKTIPGIQSVGEAMKNLGITSDAELKKIADSAKQNFDAMKAGGTASARELGEGFKVAADKAIAANNGIAPGWVQAEASLRGYTIATDAAGKQTLVSMKSAKDAIDGVTSAHGQAGTAAANHAMSVEELAAKYEDAGARAKAAAGQFLSAAKAQQDADTANSSITKNAQPPATQYGWNRSYIVDQLKQMGLDDATARKLSAEFVDNNGDVPYSNNAGQIKYGGKYGTLSEALYKAAYPYLFDDKGGKKTAEGMKPEPAKPPPQPTPTPAPPPRAPTPAPRAPTPAPTPAPQAPAPQQGGGRMAVGTPVTININGRAFGRVNTSSPEDARALSSILEQLTSDASRA